MPNLSLIPPDLIAPSNTLCVQGLGSPAVIVAKSRHTGGNLQICCALTTWYGLGVRGELMWLLQSCRPTSQWKDFFPSRCSGKVCSNACGLCAENQDLLYTSWLLGFAWRKHRKRTREGTDYDSLSLKLMLPSCRLLRVVSWQQALLLLFLKQRQWGEIQCAMQGLGNDAHPFFVHWPLSYVQQTNVEKDAVYVYLQHSLQRGWMSKMKEEKVSNGLVINKDIGILYIFLW